MASTTDEARRTLDQAALEKLYVELEKPLFNVVYRWIWNAEEARDVMQDAFLRVWHARTRVDAAMARPLLYRTALNLAANRRRARRLWGWLPLEHAAGTPTGSPSPEDAATSARSREHVRRALDALPERLRRVLLLCEMGEMSYAEVAQVLEIPAGTVGSRRNKALEILQRELGPIEGLRP